MAKHLNIAEDLSLPLDVVTEAIAWLGRRGSGKTYAAQKLAEEMHRLQAQFVTLDPVGIWYGLRLAADGKSPGLPVPVLGGLHGDIPLEVTGGALIADLVVDRGASVVIDVSQFESDADKARFAQAFANRFFFRKKASPSAVHVFLEECQEFIPQNPQAEETKMLHAFNRMVKIGRNFGIGMSMISQRPQEVNKKSLNLAEILFAFQMTGPQERKTIEGWIAEKGIDEDIAGELPKLARGEPHVWSPALLKISRRVQIDRKTTFDASSTPKVGKDASARHLSPIDLEQLRTDMAATIEKAKAEDPKLLRAEIAKLKVELSKKPSAAPAAAATRAPAGPRREDVATITALRKALENAMKFIVEINTRDFFKAAGETVDQAQIEKAITGATAAIQQMVERHIYQRNKEFAGLKKQGERVAEALQALLKDDVTLKVDVRHNEPFTVSPAPARPRQALQRPPAGPGEALPRVERAFLIALAQQARALSRNQVAIFSGYSAKSRHVDNTLASLRTKAFIEGGGDAIRITDAGAAALGAYEPLPTGAALRTYWQNELDKASSAFLGVICDAYPGTLTREEVAEKANYSPTSRHVDNTLAQLRTRELVTGNGKAIRASEELFDG